MDRLVSALRGRDLNMPQIAVELGVSASTAKRVCLAADDRVCRTGRARATTYTLRRSVAGLGDRLPVFRVDESGRVEPYGRLHLLGGGRHWLEREEGRGARFVGLPPFVVDMAPQGFIGRGFPGRYPELTLPSSIRAWSDDQRLLAVARRGEDCTGNLIIGDESLSRFLSQAVVSVREGEYPELALRALREPVGSSAAGEQPKFAVYSEGRAVLVKFATGDSPVAARWRDLLLCEKLALERVRVAGVAAATASCIDLGQDRFLEVERFDRIGARGRRGVLSLAAICAEYVGAPRTWTEAAHDLENESLIESGDARTLRWLDCFGALIGNTDRHLGNISFFVDANGRFRLAPVYDMLPMVFAPESGVVVDRPLRLLPPTMDVFKLWTSAAQQAIAYWNDLAEHADLSEPVRSRCAAAGEALRTMADRLPAPPP